MDDFFKQRHAMVARQIVARGVRDARVLGAMRELPRHEFVSATQRPQAYDDGPLPIGLGQTISQPYIVAWMTELLGVQPGEHVLEIGTGCGYQTAVLARLAGHVFSIERVAELSQQAGLTLSRLGVSNVSLRVGDGQQGWPELAPWRRMLCAAAPEAVPEDLTRQLDVGGCLVLPVGPRSGQQMTRVTRTGHGLVSETLGPVAFVPLLTGP